MDVLRADQELSVHLDPDRAGGVFARADVDQLRELADDLFSAGHAGRSPECRSPRSS